MSMRFNQIKTLDSVKIKGIELDESHYLDVLRNDLTGFYLGTYSHYVLSNLIEMYIAIVSNSIDDINTDSHVCAKIPLYTNFTALRVEDMENYKDLIKKAEEKSNIVLGEGDNPLRILERMRIFVQTISYHMFETLAEYPNLSYVILNYDPKDLPGNMIINAERDEDGLSVFFACNTIHYTDRNVSEFIGNKDEAPIDMMASEPTEFT